MVQDASFISADPGHARADKPRGEEVLTRRSKDGSWSVKGGKSYFGYKLHMKMDLNHGLIRELEASTASVHDSRVDLSEPGEVVYRDYGVPGCCASWLGWDDEAWSQRSPARDLGPAQESEDKQETVSG